MRQVEFVMKDGRTVKPPTGRCARQGSWRGTAERVSHGRTRRKTR
jgi:hypothetical protein